MCLMLSGVFTLSIYSNYRKLDEGYYSEYEKYDSIIAKQNYVKQLENKDIDFAVPNRYGQDEMIWVFSPKEMLNCFSFLKFHQKFAIMPCLLIIAVFVKMVIYMFLENT